MKENGFLTHQALKFCAIDWDQYFPEFFVYNPPSFLITGAAAGVIDTQTVNIQADAPFIWIACGIDIRPSNGDFNKYAAGANTPIYEPTSFSPEIFCQFYDSGVGTNIFQDYTPVRFVGGQNGNDPFILPVPRILAANSSLNILTQSFDTNENKVSYALLGAKVKPRGTPVNTGLRIPRGFV